MKLNRGKKIMPALIGVGLAMVLGLAFFIFSNRDGSRPPANPQDTSSQAAMRHFGLHASATEALTPEQREKMLVDRLVLELQQRYGKTISRIDTQATLLDVKKQIMALFPGDAGLAEFYQILRLAFPDDADAVIATLDKLEQYQRWLADNEGLLYRMSAYDRKAALWEKQRELFGDDADEIWSGELMASEVRTAAMQDIMAVIGESREISIEEKLDIFQDALRQTYENSPDDHVLGQRFMLAKVFFSIDSVQEDLKAMSPELRQFEMDQIRRELRLSEQEIENMKVLDAARDRQWETGLSYMEEREAVLLQYRGPEQEEKLKALREKYFQDEANTIALEENDDFFRFNRPRIYGRN
jgi:hypothetical protein